MWVVHLTLIRVVLLFKLYLVISYSFDSVCLVMCLF